MAKPSEDLRRCAASLNRHGIPGDIGKTAINCFRIEDAKQMGLTTRETAKLLDVSTRTVQLLAGQAENVNRYLEDGTPVLSRLLRAIRNPATLPEISQDLGWSPDEVEKYLKIGLKTDVVAQMGIQFVATGKAYVPRTCLEKDSVSRTQRIAKVMFNSRAEQQWISDEFAVGPTGLKQLAAYLSPAENDVTPCKVWVERAWKMLRTSAEGPHNFGLVTALGPAMTNCGARSHTLHAISTRKHVDPHLVTLDDHAMAVFQSSELPRIQEEIRTAIAAAKQKDDELVECKRYQVSVLWAYSENGLCGE